MLQDERITLVSSQQLCDESLTGCLAYDGSIYCVLTEAEVAQITVAIRLSVFVFIWCHEIFSAIK